MNVTELILTRNQIADAANDKRARVKAKWCSPDVLTTYAPAYVVQNIYDELEKITADELEKNKALNNELNAEIDRLTNSCKYQFFSDFNKKIPDRDLKIANALSVIQALDTELTGTDLVRILSPFQNDPDALAIFKRICEEISKKLILMDRLELDMAPAFANYDNYSERVTLLTEMKTIASSLFLHAKAYLDRHDTIFLEHAFTFFVVDSYDELNGQGRMLELAEAVYNSPKKVYGHA